MNDNSFIEHYQVLTPKESFISKQEPKVQPILEHRLKQNEKWKKEKKERAKSLAEVTKSLIEGTYIEIGDENDLTISELLVAKATANMLNKEDLSFKDISDMQKVTNDETEKTNGGFTLVINTNGQNLGS